jgi:enolase
MKITEIDAYQILDSRGNPTIETEVVLDDGSRERGLVPSGASTGQFEALELRDGDPSRFGGLGVERAIRNVRDRIRPAILGMEASDQRTVDEAMISLDGTPSKTQLGANAILSVSMALAKAAAAARRLPLYAHLGGESSNVLPVPHIQIIGGGAHANWRTDVQDYMVVAVGASTYSAALEMTQNVYRATGELLHAVDKRYGVADEGGFWPNFAANEEPLELLVRAIERAGYQPGRDVALSLDFAASDLYDETIGHYHFRLENRRFTRDEFAALVCHWCRNYPITSIEDPMADVDAEGWKIVASELTSKVQIVGDDLFTTNIDRIRWGADLSLANAVLIKLNQIGTVSETLDAIRATHDAGWRPIVSARSGETEDAFICHLAVATNAGQIKVGSIARGERTAKWNELLRIERQLGERATYAGGPVMSAIGHPQRSQIIFSTM